jgi:uncharacterized protein
MKIVSFGDVHMATANLARMGAVLRDTDLIIVSGDLTNFGGPDEAGKVIGVVRGACANVLALPGNLDRREVIPMLEHEGIALHGKGVVRDGIGIFGCGGSNITPFNTPTELSEDEIYDTLMRGYAEVREIRPLLMVCHTPPLRPNAIVSWAGGPSGARRRGVLSRRSNPTPACRGISMSRRRSTILGRRLSSTPGRSRMAVIS